MKTKRLTACAMMLAIFIVLGLFPPISLGFIPVPIVIQNLAVLLCGLLLTKWEALSVTLVFLLMAAVGLPVLSGSTGGFAVFMGPSAGYLFAYPLCAFLIALAKEHINTSKNTFIKIFFMVFVIGVLLLDAIGAVGMSINISGMSLATALKAQLAFIPGDTVKAVLATLIYTLIPAKVRAGM